MTPSSTAAAAAAQVIAGAKLKVLIIEGKDLIAKDRSIQSFGRRTTSDPYVILYWGQPESKSKSKNKNNTTKKQDDGYDRRIGKTKTIEKNCANPKWKEFFEVVLGANRAERFLKQREPLELQIWDDDQVTSDDFMGVVLVDVIDAMLLGPRYKAYPVQQKSHSGNFVCHSAKGCLEVQVTAEVRKLITVERGSSHLLRDRKIMAGVAWTVERNRHIDIDSSCVAVDNQGCVGLEDTVYYNNARNSNGSLVHSGDERSGESADEEEDDDEVIAMDLDTMPNYIVALYFILTISERSWADVKSARIRFISADTGWGICQMVPSDLVGSGQPNTALFLLRISRGKDDPNKWFLTPIGDGDERARDFGTLIPQLRHYTKDLVPNMSAIDPFERVALLKKSGTIRLCEYLETIPQRLTMGLAWQITDGVNIDLDASAILLGKDCELIDIVWFGHSVSDNNGAVLYTGDQKTGAATGDDESMTVSLNAVPKDVKYIGFSVNSFSGEPLKDVSQTSCHFYNPDSTKADSDIARHVMAGSNELQDKTGLLMVCLFRGDTDDTDWYLHVLSKPVYGRKAQENLTDWQECCKKLHPMPNLHQEVFRAMPESFLSGDETQLVSAEDLDKMFPKKNI